MKASSAFLFLSLITGITSANAISGADVGLSKGEVEAAYTSVSPDGLTRSYVSNGQFMPGKHLRLGNDKCKNFADGGGHCIDLAGGGAFGEVASVKYYWRLSDKGHESAWQACDGTSGCRAFNYQKWDNGRTAATFLISHVDVDGQRDLRMDVTFSKLTTPPSPKQAAADPAAKVYENWERTSNRSGKHN